MNQLYFTGLGEHIMTELLQDYIRFTTTTTLQLPGGVRIEAVETHIHSAIKLNIGRIVSRESTDYQDNAGLVRYTAQFQNAPDFKRPFSQDADLAILVRDELDKDPLIVDGKPHRDGSDLYQRLDTIFLFTKGKDGRYKIDATDLHRMYPDDFAKQLDAATKIGRGIEVDLDDSLVADIRQSNGKRSADLPQTHWPYEVPLRDCRTDAVVTAFAPTQSERLADHQARHNKSPVNCYLLNKEIPRSLKNGEKGFIMTGGLGGSDVYYTLVASGGNVYNGSGQARAGSADAKNSP